MPQDPSTYGFSGMQGSCLYPDDEWPYDSSIQLRQIHTDDTCLLRPESYTQLSSQHLTVGEQERSSKALVSDWQFSFPDNHGAVPFYPDPVFGDLRRSISPDETDRSEASIIDHTSYTWTQFPVDPPSPEQLSVSSYTNSLSYMQNCTLAPMSSSFSRESSDMHSASFPAAYVSPTIISAPPLSILHVGENYTEIGEFEQEQLVSPFPSDISHHDGRASISEPDLSDQCDDDKVSQMITPPASHSDSPIEEDEDSDYRPDHTRMSRRGTQAARTGTQVLRASRATRVSKSTAPRVNGSHSTRGGRPTHGIRPNGNTHGATSAAVADNKHKMFTCPLQPYGCTSTCASKNEWKRHITSQHILLDTWRCNLCPVEESEKKIFNRRDLFTQHLRRMHKSCGDPASHQGDCAITTDKPGMKPRRKSGAGRASDKAGNGKGSGSPENDPALEARLKEIQDRCCFRIRDPPATYMCAQCEHLFEGPKAQDKWLEHVAHHLSANGAAAIEWEKDAHLRSWLLAEGLLETTHKGLRLKNLRNSDSRA